MSIETNNVKLANFMGRAGKVRPDLFYVNIPSVHWVTIEQLEYHKSWEWLMSVITRLKAMHNDRTLVLHNLTLGVHYCSMKVQIGDQIFKVEHAVHSDMLEPVYEMIVKFIQWYEELPIPTA